MSHLYRLSLGRVEGSPVKPAPRFCRAVLAQVFNRDNWQDDVTWAEATIIMGAKLLKDAGHEDDHIVSIFRFFRDEIIKWTDEMAARTAVDEHVRGHPNRSSSDTWNMLVLAVMDNQCATLIGVHCDRKVFDFRRGIEATDVPVPILQVSVTLSSLLELVVAPEPPARSAREGVGAPGAAVPSRPAGP